MQKTITTSGCLFQTTPTQGLCHWGDQQDAAVCLPSAGRNGGFQMWGGFHLYCLPLISQMMQMKEFLLPAKQDEEAK